MATATVSALLRANQAYYAQLCETCSLEQWGIAFTAKEAAYARVAEANQFREIVIDETMRPAEVYAAVEEHFGVRGLSCLIWAPAADAPTDALGSFLAERGFVRREIVAMGPTAGVDRPADDRVRVLPARAMRRAMREIHGRQYASVDGATREALVSAAVERLNDPRMDGFVAMHGSAAVGYGVLFQIGDVGRISALHVVEGARRQGVGRALIGQMVRLARRLALRVVCMPVPSD